jgi:hypothetical protein
MVGFSIRYTAILNLLGPPEKTYPTMDEMDYREFANNIINFKTYSAYCQGFLASSTRAPVYPLIIASIYKLDPNNNFSDLKYLNLIIDMINILLVFLLAYSIFNSNTALFSAFFYAVFGHAVFYMLQSSPHTIGIMLFLSVCLTVSKIHKHYWALTPVLILLYTILIHTRPVFLIAIPLLPLGLWLQLKDKNKINNDKNEKTKNTEINGDLKTSSILQRSEAIRIFTISDFIKKKSVKSISPVIIILFLCLPWGIRNYKIHKTLVPVCTVAGWHIANNINFDIKLSIKYFTDNLYAAEHKNFTEGQYFNFAKEEFFKTFFNNPIKFIAFGFGRLIYLWSPPTPYLRFLLPQSYIFPIYLNNSLFIPLLDFEGLLYITFILSIIIILKNSKKREEIKTFISDLSFKIRGPAILCLSYSLVHIIGIPLIAYRLFIEPLIAILCIYIIISIFRSFSKKANNRITKDSSKDRSPINIFTISTLYTVTILSIFLIFIPIISTPAMTSKIAYMPIDSNTKKCPTDKSKMEDGFLTYKKLKQIQWENKGNIPVNTKIIFQGIIRYIHKNFKYVNNDYYAVYSLDHAASRIFIQYNSNKNPLGIGDARLNFNKLKNLPKNESAVIIYGTASTGVFKEIIVNVSSWKYLNNK